MNKRRKNGFTLVECIVAIAVISIITAAAILIFNTSVRTITDSWDNYRVTIMADNIISAFQASENAQGDFTAKLTAFGASKGKDDETQEFDYSTFIHNGEYEVSKRMIPQVFGSIRAYEEKGKVTFKAADNTVINSIDYGTGGRYSEDSEVFTNTGLYSKTYEDKIPTLTKVTVSGSVDKNGSEKNSTNPVAKDARGRSHTYDYSKVVGTYDFSYTITEKKVTIESELKSASDTNLELSVRRHHYEIDYDCTSLERDLFHDGQFLYFNSSSASGNGNPVYLIVYSAKEKGPAQPATNEDGQFICYKVSGGKQDPSKKWYEKYETKGKFVVTKIEQIYLSALPTDYSQYPASGTDVSDDYKDMINKGWYLPSYASDTFLYKNDNVTETKEVFYSLLAGSFVIEGLDLFDVPPISVDHIVSFMDSHDAYCPEISVDYDGDPNGRVIYTDYTVKSGSNSDITYAIKKSSSLDLYNSQDTLMYSCTDPTKYDTICAVFGFTEDDDYQPGEGHEGWKRYCQYELSVFVNGVFFDDDNHRLSFYAEKDGERTELFGIQYGSSSSTSYENGKASIVSGDYHTLYSMVDDHTYTLVTPGAPSAVETENGWDINIGGTVIFRSFGGRFESEYVNTANAPDSFREVLETQKGTAVSKWFSYRKGNYVCVSKATFSEATGTVAGFSPQIQIWIISYADYQAWLDGELTLNNNDAYYNYMKG